MKSELLSAREAAQLLGIRAATLYEWLAQSDSGEFKIRGVPITINYLQGGRRGQGRIQIESGEVERLKEAMRVHPRQRPARQPLPRRQNFPGITVPLGRPDRV